MTEDHRPRRTREVNGDAGGSTATPDRPIEPSAPEAFGRVQVWWGDGKGKTTAALGLALRAAGHGFRSHVLQFMKGGAASVEDVRGEHRAISSVPGLTIEHGGHYGWHGPLDGTDDERHAEQARAGLERARKLLTAAGEADLNEPRALDGPPDAGVHLLVLDEILYAANRELITPEEVVGIVETKPADLELVLTGGHRRPDYLYDAADLISQVNKEKHPFDAGVGARRGTEY